jgi:CheY-like chemotaxis protein
MLERVGLRVDVAANGYEALAALEQDSYDLIIMDLQMPGMNGFEATVQIRRRERSGRRTPIIALTTFTTEDDRKRCLEAGMDDHVPKPVESSSLHASIAKWLGRTLPRVQERPSGGAPADAPRPAATSSRPTIGEVTRRLRDAQRGTGGGEPG